jgi:ketosteroid isomerase-like protein
MNTMIYPNSNVVAGRSAISAFWQGAMDMGIKTAKLETVELEGVGDAVAEVGKYTLGGEDSQVIDSGKYLVIWQQEDGK